MDTFIVHVHKWKNTNYEIGRKQMQSIQHKPSYVSLLQSLTSDLVDFEKGTSLFREYAPHLLTEIQGLGDELGLSYQEAFRYFSGCIAFCKQSKSATRVYEPYHRSDGP